MFNKDLHNLVWFFVKSGLANPERVQPPNCKILVFAYLYAFQTPFHEHQNKNSISHYIYIFFISSKVYNCAVHTGFEKIYNFFILGGWICHDSSSCLERSIRENKFMSSDNWETVKSVGGILSADPQENPYFADANHVFVPYCSSDSWSGTVSHKNEDGFNFMGRHIVREVIRELSEYQVRLLLSNLKIG